ncbi:hypothetical protein HMPREF1869_00816 [Bacteroidales bacterium KA00251]|nr:hypothetical protein HMPREF1869_00816 [Bacteroidales bacterium KA00251]
MQRFNRNTHSLSSLVHGASVFFSVVAAKELVHYFCGEVVRKVVSLKEH